MILSILHFLRDRDLIESSSRSQLLRWDNVELLSTSPLSRVSEATHCFEFLDEYPMAMGCHKSVFRVKSCSGNNSSNDDVYILATHEESDRRTSQQNLAIEAGMLSRAPSGTVPNLIAHCSGPSSSEVNDDNQISFLVQEMLLDGRLFLKLMNNSNADIRLLVSDVAKLKIAASGFDALRLFENFPLAIFTKPNGTKNQINNINNSTSPVDVIMRNNRDFATGLTDVPIWPTMHSSPLSQPQWTSAKIFYRDFGLGQMGISLQSRQLKIFDLVSPFILSYESSGAGVGSQLSCKRDEDCWDGYAKRVIRMAKLDNLNDGKCDNKTNSCFGLDSRTHVYLMSHFFREFLSHIEKNPESSLIHDRLREFMSKVRSIDPNERPTASEAVAILYSMAKTLTENGAEDWIDIDTLQSELLRPWVTESWNKTCGKTLRIAQTFITDANVARIGNCEVRLRKRHYSV